MASVNDLILESNVRERLYPAMPFKILQIYMKTARACLKIIPAICTPHFAGDFTRIRLP